MSESNVELVRRGYEAIARGDFELIEEILDPEVVWHGSDGPGTDSCHNRAEALQFMRAARRRGALEELVDVIDAGDSVVVVMRPRRSGEPDDSHLRANVTTFRDGKVIRMVAHESPEAALAAAGLPPDQGLESSAHTR